MARITVAPLGRQPQAPRPPRGPLTPIVRSAPFVAESVDGLWVYGHDEDDQTTWSVRYRPTGQIRSHFATLDDAREATAGGLYGELRWQAVTAAFDPDRSRRAEGQHWLAVHLARSGMTAADATHRCDGCGGALAVVRDDGSYAHLADASGVVACGDPDPILSRAELLDDFRHHG